MIIRYVLAYSLSTFFSLACNGQSNECKFEYDGTLKRNIYIYADSMPRFPGNMIEFINTHLHVTEPSQGSFHVNLEFVIDTSGSIIEQTIQSKQKHEQTHTETEVLALLDQMPLWQPGYCHKKKVPVRYFLPIIVN